MARHRKQEDLQAKADAFDKQWEESRSHGSPRVVGDLPSSRERRDQKTVTEEHPEAKGKWFRR